MRWPIHPIESVRPSRFRPPFCPWPECIAHRCRRRGFHRHGSYRIRSERSPVPRARCLDCKRTCSRRTFSTRYYMKRPTLLAQVAAGLTAGSAHRQIARSTRSSKTSVTRIAERLGRHAALFHSRALASGIRIREPVVHDHFETFIGRQDHALGGGTAVGARSWFVYDVDPAPHRGSGRRPDRQAKEPETVSTPYVSSIRRTVAGLLELLPTDEPLHLIADGRADYRFALRRKDLGGRIVLHAYPNPKRGPKGTPRSAEAIARDAAMFPVDSLHQFVRHTCADHKRETIAFGRRCAWAWRKNPGTGRGSCRDAFSPPGKRCPIRRPACTSSAGRPGSPSSAVRTPSSANPVVESSATSHSADSASAVPTTLRPP